MAVNKAFEVEIDSTESADTFTDIMNIVQRSIERYTVTLADADGTWVTGASTVSNVVVKVGSGGSVDRGVIVRMDTAVVGTGAELTILKNFLQSLERYTTTVTYAASYVEGSRVFNAEWTIS